jgi:PAP2 superfamily
MRAASIEPAACSGPCPGAVTRWRRASRRELIVLGIYFTMVIVLTDVFNVRLGVELLTLAVVLPAVAISRAAVRFLKDWWFFLAGLVMWNLSGPIAAESMLPLHMDFMLNLDKALFFGHIPNVVVQQHLANGTHVDALDWITGAVYNMHLPEPYIAAYFLWRLSRPVYFQFVSAALLLLVIGMISFIVFPAVPPWMAWQRYHAIPEVLNRFGLVLHAHPMPFHGTPIFYVFKFRGDSVAAFPSEHAAFPLLELLAFSRVVSRKVIVMLSGWVLFVLFSIVYLGEHWVTDALAGYIYALVIFGAVVWFCSGGPWHLALAEQ